MSGRIEGAGDVKALKRAGGFDFVVGGFASQLNTWSTCWLRKRCCNTEQLCVLCSAMCVTGQSAD